MDKEERDEHGKGHLGCDYCGDEKDEPITGWRGGGKGNWKTIYLHKSCAKLFREQIDAMK